MAIDKTAAKMGRSIKKCEIKRTSVRVSKTRRVHGACRVHEAKRNAPAPRGDSSCTVDFRAARGLVHCASLHAPYKTTKLTSRERLFVPEGCRYRAPTGNAC